jgi:hypothetical protein
LRSCGRAAVPICPFDVQNVRRIAYRFQRRAERNEFGAYSPNFSLQKSLNAQVPDDAFQFPSLARKSGGVLSAPSNLGSRLAPVDRSWRCASSLAPAGVGLGGNLAALLVVSDGEPRLRDGVSIRAG